MESIRCSNAIRSERSLPLSFVNGAYIYLKGDVPEFEKNVLRNSRSHPQYIVQELVHWHNTVHRISTVDRD